MKNRHNFILSLQGITLLQDAGTSDDSGRASERLTGSSVAPRDPDSSRDRLSDVRILLKKLHIPLQFSNDSIVHIGSFIRVIFCIFQKCLSFIF